MVQLPRERFTPHRTCGGQMGPAHKARDDGDCYVRFHPSATPARQLAASPTPPKQNRRRRGSSGADGSRPLDQGGR
ncbi:hypothetical protein CA607_05235 [Caulobacter vibrioides]|nr:hypothetical protein CA607_05235 [Caulobacter vibrioides]